MKPALVILAAGASRRLGECKALVDLAGETPLERLVGAGRCLDEVPALVVTGLHDAEIRARAPREVEVLHNPEWERGRSGGIVRAQRERPGRDLMIAPVDCPCVPSEVFEALTGEWMRRGAPPAGWLAPRFVDAEGSARTGHPVIVGRALVAQMETWPPDRPLRSARDQATVLWSIDTARAEILDNLDRPEVLEKLAARLRRDAEDPRPA